MASSVQPLPCRRSLNGFWSSETRRSCSTPTWRSSWRGDPTPDEQVRRNRARFPADFIFELSGKEFADLESPFATSSWGGRQELPLAFTEHGAIMAATVLNTPRLRRSGLRTAEGVGRQPSGVGEATRRLGTEDRGTRAQSGCLQSQHPGPAQAGV